MLGTARTLTNVVLLGGATIWAGTNSLFNVEGGHRAIVFNRLVGIKDTVHRQAAAAGGPDPGPGIVR